MSGSGMRLLIEVLALFVIGAIILSIAIVVLGRNPLKLAQGELRCEGGGAIIINVGGKDYAVNGMAGPGSADTKPLEQILLSGNRHRSTDRSRLNVM